MRRQASASHIEGVGVAEVPNVPVTISNAGGQASKLFAEKMPIRQSATVYINGDAAFSGTIFSININGQMVFQIEG